MDLPSAMIDFCREWNRIKTAEMCLIRGFYRAWGDDGLIRVARECGVGERKLRKFGKIDQMIPTPHSIRSTYRDLTRKKY